MPDFFRGNWIDPYNSTQEELTNFLKTTNLQVLENDIFNTVLPSLKQPIQSMAMIGFCWGAIPAYLAMS